MSDEGKKKSRLSRFAESLFEEADKYLSKGMGGKPMPKERTFQTEDKLIVDREKLRRELKIEVEKSGQELKKFMEIAESLEEIIPEEDKRFNAAVKAFQSASGFRKEDILLGIDNQLAELKRQREIFARSSAKRKNELRAQSAKVNDIKEQISLLRENIRRLEEEEMRIAADMTTHTDKINAAEERFGEVADSLEAEIIEIKDNILEYVSGKTSNESPTVAQEIEGVPHDAKVKLEEAYEEELDEVADLTDKIAERIEQKTSGKRAKEAGERMCPICNNKMEWFEISKLWRCFVCGEEEKV